MAKVIIYQDLNMKDPTTTSVVTDINVIYQAIDILFKHTTMSRLFNPSFSLDLEDELFEFVDDRGAEEILTRVTDAIEKNLSVVTLLHNKTKVTPIYNENKYEIDLYFQVDGFGDTVFNKSPKIGL